MNSVSIADAISACGAPIMPATERNASIITLKLGSAMGQLYNCVGELESNPSAFARRRAEEYFGDALYHLLQLAMGAGVCLDDLEVDTQPVPRSLVSFHDSATTGVMRPSLFGQSLNNDAGGGSRTQPPSVSTPGASPKGIQSHQGDDAAAGLGSVIMPTVAPQAQPGFLTGEFSTSLEPASSLEAALPQLRARIVMPTSQHPGDSFSSSRTESPQQVSGDQFPFSGRPSEQAELSAAHLARVVVPPLGSPSLVVESPNRSQPSSARGIMSAEGIKGCLRKTPRNTNSGSPRPEDFIANTPSSGQGAGGQTVQFADFPFVQSTTEVPGSFIVPAQNPPLSHVVKPPTSFVHSPPALRSRDGSFHVPASTTMLVTHTGRAAGTDAHSRTSSNVRTPASPTGQPLFGLVDEHIFITSDDDMLGTLNAVTVMSIHSATASPGGQRLVPPRGSRRGPSPRPASTPALAFQQMPAPAALHTPPIGVQRKPYSPPSALRSTGDTSVPVVLPTAVAVPQVPSKEDLDSALLAGPPQFGSDHSEEVKSPRGGGEDDEDEDDGRSSIGSGNPVHIQQQQPIDSGSFALGSSTMESSNREEAPRRPRPNDL